METERGDREAGDVVGRWGYAFYRDFARQIIGYPWFFHPCSIYPMSFLPAYLLPSVVLFHRGFGQPPLSLVYTLYRIVSRLAMTKKGEQRL